jgi:hypothetical protein
VFCKKLGNFKNKPAGVLKIFYDQMPTLPSSDFITRFDGTFQRRVPVNCVRYVLVKDDDSFLLTVRVRLPHDLQEHVVTVPARYQL